MDDGADALPKAGFVADEVLEVVLLEVLLEVLLGVLLEEVLLEEVLVVLIMKLQWLAGQESRSARSLHPGLAARS